MRLIAIIALMLSFQFLHARTWELKGGGKPLEGEIFKATKLSLVLIQTGNEYPYTTAIWRIQK